MRAQGEGNTDYSALQTPRGNRQAGLPCKPRTPAGTGPRALDLVPCRPHITRTEALTSSLCSEGQTVHCISHV